jgi:hypothetical protein
MLNTGSGQWVCVKTCCHFVQGKAAQESILCTPVVLAFFLHPQFFSLEFFSNSYALVFEMVGLAFLSASLNGL